MMAENYGFYAANMITSANEIFELLAIDVPRWLNGDSSSAFEFHDYANNQMGIMLWEMYDNSK